MSESGGGSVPMRCASGLPEDYVPPHGARLIMPVRDPGIVFGSDERTNFVRAPDGMLLRLKSFPKRGGVGFSSFLVQLPDGRDHRVGRIKIHTFQDRSYYLVRVTALSDSIMGLKDTSRQFDLDPLIPFLSEFYIQKSNDILATNFQFLDERLCAPE
ncbi:hypothetical protein [Sphingomicrobium aestuariivivum]|uniref:hypothetical protein n=1 Tax=Sphingomicrobium aestuariivivum TaxID=1582356 RepID=UPI001FD673A2|nr:hypothetical protein [Sphingomicrobium aestuariivivum]MCJ8191434.1 hypothetical protein [Sphingomicrobium aestuariivivum]